jgi:serine/arginine repetitive matrix protein 2
MVKKKGKKGQKQVETAPPDSAPATGEPIPEVPEVPLTAEAPHSGTEGQPQTEIPATEVTSGEQSVPSLPEVEPTEGTVAVPAELPTPALSPHLENSEPIVSNTTQLPATEIASALEQDPTIKKEEEIEPQAVPTQITEGQNIEQNPEAPQPTTTAASENVQPMPTEATKVPATVTATLALKQNQSLANEEDSTQSLGESAHASLLNSRSETAEEPERVTPEPPVVSIEDAGHPLALVDARGLEVDTKAPSHSHPSHADNFSILKRPMDIEADEEREEPHAEEAEEASIVPETPFALLQDLRTSPTVIEQQPVTAPSTTVSEELQPSAPEAPLAQLELFERSITEAQGLTDAADEKRRRKAARLERYRLEQDRLDEQELEQKRLEYEAKQAAEQAQEAETKEFERLAQETAERTWLEEEDLEKQRLEQEAEARQLLKRMEEEKHATEAQEKMIADEAAEQVREAEVKADEERKELESKAEQDRIDTEKSEQEAIARQLLKQMELERHAEAQESARAAEQARQEAKVKEEQHRVEIERLEVEAREAAEFAEKTQREVKQAEIARIAAEQALDEPIPDPNWSEPHQVLTTPVPQQDPVVAYTRAPIPRSAASSPHDRPASATSDRPSRSYRSPAPHVPKLRTQEAGPNHALRPQAISQLIEDNRPPAPSPPIGRARPRYVYAHCSFLNYISVSLRRS